MTQMIPLVDAMTLIRQWPWEDARQSDHIDLLIEAVLIQRYPSPEWIISLRPSSRVIHVAHWRRVESEGRELWTIDPEAVCDIDCARLEAAGETWLWLAQSQMP